MRGVTSGLSILFHWVFNHKIFKNYALARILSEDFSVNFMQILSLAVQATLLYTSVLEDDSSSEYSSDTDSVNIKPIKTKTLVIDSDVESENEIRWWRMLFGSRKLYSCVSVK